MFSFSGSLSKYPSPFLEWEAIFVWEASLNWDGAAVGHSPILQPRESHRSAL